MAESQAQNVGRPSSQVDMEAIQYLKTLGMSVKDIAQTLGVSRQTIYNKIRSSGNPSAYATYSDISDGDLDSVVSSIIVQHPNNGGHDRWVSGI